MKVAVTDLAASIVIEQVLVPPHVPLQPVKVVPDAALAVSVTEVAALKLAAHIEPQLMPTGEDVTVPDPVPAFVIASEN